MQSIDCLDDYWSSPDVNWFDYFVDRKQFDKLLAHPKANKRLISKLAIQFSEQAVFTERERDQLFSKGFPDEDVQFSQRKCACLWLCCLACFSAVDWDFEYLLDNHDILEVRPLVDYSLRMFNAEADHRFGVWLHHRYILSITQRYRIPRPPPKQTVNNPAVVPDANIARHENIRRAVNDTKVLLSAAIQFLEDVIQFGHTVFIPDTSSFLRPFLEGCGMALSVGISGSNVLFNGLPRPNITDQGLTIQPVDIANQARYDLILYYFSEGDHGKVRKFLEEIRAPSIKHSLISFDIDRLMSYAAIFRIQVPVENNGQPPTRQVNKSRLHKWKKMKMASRRVQKQVFAENLASNVVDGVALALRSKLVDDNSLLLPFVEYVKRESVVGPSTGRLRSLLAFLSLTVPQFKEVLLRSGVDCSSFGSLLGSTALTSILPPGKNIISAFLKSEQPLWTTIISFDVPEIKDALSKITGYTLPHHYRCPELLGDRAVLKRPVVDLHILLFGKLQQLCRIKNPNAWQLLCNAVVAELGASGAQNQMRFVLEAIRVQSFLHNAKMNVSWESIQGADFQSHFKTTKTLFSNTQTVNMRSATDVYREVLALCLNARDYDFIINKFELNMQIVTLVQLLAAFCVHSGSTTPGTVTGLRKLTEAWIAQILPLFESTVRDGSQFEREVVLKQLMEFLAVVKEPSLLPFLISTFGFLFNRILLAHRKPQLKLFVEMSDMFPTVTELRSANMEAIEQCLRTVLRNAATIPTVNKLYLRTAADYYYAKSNVTEASKLYMELLLSCQPSLTVPLPKDVVDDTVLLRLKACLKHYKCYHLAALLCQFLSSRLKEEYERSMEIIWPRLSVDGGVDCSSMIFDQQLMENLSTLYMYRRQSRFNNRMMKWACSPAINSNNRADLLNRERRRRGERLLNVLASYIFGAL